MRTVFLLALLAALGLGGWLALNADTEAVRTVPMTASAEVEGVSVPKALPAEVAQPKAADTPAAPAEPAAPADKAPADEVSGAPEPLVPAEPASADGLETAACLRYGPVSERALPAQRRKLERIGLLDRMLLEETDTAVYTVLCGPFPSASRANRELKRLKAEGLRDGVTVEVPSRGWAIRMGASRDRELASQWARRAAAHWNLTNVVITSERRYKKAFDLIFPRLSAKENEDVRKAFGRDPDARLTPCY